ncbi:uncharacterized protein [Lepeophtheirus salmonis]|uniref:uncharacterized protein isoform X2 n=1 Tax=Lepeophtheirus salmonis TaxID=72036 RepID=UPI001AE85856|nr:uncharacterized protein LOC121118518 isoform X2 [Lepeophtheirus salmonis]
MNFKWVLLFVLIESSLQSKDEDGLEKALVGRSIRKRQISSTIDLDEVMGFLRTRSTVKFIANVGVNQFIVGIGWFLSGIIWSVLITMTEEGSTLNNMLGMTSDILSATPASVNVLRCLTAFILLSLGILVKTLLTIGLGETIGLFKKEPLMDMVTSLLKDREFVIGSIKGAVFSSIFQINFSIS